MSNDITWLLRSMLYQVSKAKTLGEAKAAIEVMCSGDDIAAVKEKIAEHNKQEV